MVAKKKKIRTLKGYMTWVTKINGNNPHRFLFRGLPNKKWDAEASAIRRHPKYPDEVNLAWLREYNKDLIYKARARDYHYKDGKEHKEDLPLLAELQHHGAATALIDFSENPLVALYFACQAKKDTKTGEVIKTGKVIAVANDEEVEDAQSEIDKKDTQSENKNSIEHFLNNTRLWKWRPPNNNHRILAQQSVFLFGSPVIKGDIEIEIADKEKLLKELKNYGVDEEKLFPDFYGFANINAHNKPYDNIDYLAKGIDAIQNQNYQAAIEDYNKAIAINLNDADAYNSRGVAKYKLGKYIKAIEDFNQAIVINPYYADAYYSRGVVKSKLGKHVEAIKNFNQVIKINPDYAEAYNNRGVAKANLGEHAEAIKDYDEAIKINSKHAKAYNNRGVAKDELGRYVEAIKDFDEAIKINPNFDKALIINPKLAEAYHSRGLTQAKLGNYADAIKDFDKALEINPKLAEAYHNRGLAKDNLGEHTEAIEDYDEAIKINTNFAEAYAGRGLAKGRLGNYADAIDDFKKALLINPKLVAAKENLALAKKLLSEQRKKKDDE